MNIYTVRDNIKNTIVDKKQTLAEIRSTFDGRDIATYATIEFLKVNIAELEKILADVEICCKSATADSWRDNPDRQAGSF